MAKSKKVALTDGSNNLPVATEHVSYMESFGWQRVVPLEDDDDGDEGNETPEGKVDESEAQELAAALAKAEAANAKDEPKKVTPAPRARASA